MPCRTRPAHLLLALALTAAPVPTLADTVTGDRAGDMAIDLVVLRPLGLAATAVGGVLFVLGLPFTLPSGSVGESACEWIQRPADYTFKRPLGDLYGCGGADCQPCPTHP